MAISKKKRHSLILHIVSGEVISSQKELLARLREHGVQITQATLSRDIKALGLVKVAEGARGYRYLPAERGAPKGLPISGSVVRSIASAGHLLVVHTLPGYAQSVASAIDAVGWKDLLGTVGGDDTVLIVLEDQKAAAGIKKRLSLFFHVENEN